MASKEKTPSPSPEAPPTEVRKRIFGKKLATHIPFVKWHVGLVVCGKVERKFTNNSGYGEKANITLKLMDACEFVNADGEVVSLAEGEQLNVGHTAGLNTCMTLDLETMVQIDCFGKKELDKGRKPAWEFDIDYQ